MKERTFHQPQKITQMLTMASFSLAVSTVSILLFRGPISILSALLIPAIIVLFSKGSGMTYYVIVSMGMMILSVMFFQTQVIFMALYVFLAIALRMLVINQSWNLVLSISGVLLYLFTVVLALFSGIWLTEKLLLVPIHTMMQMVSDGRVLVYFLILLIESVLVTLCNFLVLGKFGRLKVKNKF